MKNRKETIFEYIQIKKSVSNKQISDFFDVSRMTVHRLTRELYEEKKLELHHGWVKIASGFKEKNFIEDDIEVNKEIKQDIAKYVSKTFIRSQKMYSFDTKAIICSIIDQLKDSPLTADIGVVTNSFFIANKATRILDIGCVFCSGGLIRSASLSTIGKETESFFKDYKTEIVFLGCDSINSNLDIIESDISEVEIKKQMMLNANMTILLLESNQYNDNEGHVISNLSHVGHVVIDKNISHLMKEKLDALSNTKLHIVNTGV